MFGPVMRVSSIFSGIGTEMAATAILSDHYAAGDGPSLTFEHTCAFEVRKAARDVLTAREFGAVFGDLFELLPGALRTWIETGGHSLEALQKAIVTARPTVAHMALCRRAGRSVEVCLGSKMVS